MRRIFRTIRKNPVYAAVAVGTLALGIAANTAIFSMVSGVLLRPLPYPDPGRLVTVLHRGSLPVSPADFVDFQRQSSSFEQVAGAGGWSAAMTGPDRTEQIIGLQLTAGMFEMLGVAPLLGRAFLGEEFQPGSDRVVVLTHRSWRRRFGGDPAAVGRTLILNGAPHVVVGVMPPQFQFSPFWITDAEMYAPLPLAGNTASRFNRFLRVFARLKHGRTVEQAQAEMDAITAGLARAYPESNAGFTVRVEPLREKVVGNVRPALLALLGAVAFVLLIACANAANLALARAAERRKEYAIRAALGAGRARLLRESLVESVALALAGGLLGVALAFWGLEMLKAFFQEGALRHAARLPRLDEIGIDAPVLGFSALVSVLAGVLFGLGPAWQAGRGGVGEVLNDGARGSSGGPRGIRLRGALVIAEVALSLVLLAGAGLLLRSFLLLRAIDPGFDPQRVLTLTVSVAGQAGLVGARRESFYRGVVREVKALPGVREASMVNHLPLAGDTWGVRVHAESLPPPQPGQEIGAVYRVCRPDYFRTLEIRMLRGRDFADSDEEGAPRVVIVNQRLAERLWPSADAVGKRLTTDDPRRNPTWMTVVGVVANVKQAEWAAEPGEELYVPFFQESGFLSGTQPSRSYMTLVVRTSVDPLSLAGGVQNAIWRLNRSAAVSDVRSLGQVIASSLRQPRFHLTVMGLFAGFAMVLAAIGIYGVMDYTVRRRTHEIGIRMALGARRAAVLWMVLRQALALVLAGVALGLAAALALTRSLAKLLYGVTPGDPATFAVLPLALVLIAALAAYVPARRAAAVDPAAALRGQ